MNRKASHVGIVLSFVVFISFLMFLFSIIQPQLETQKEKKFVLDSLDNLIIENTTSELRSITFIKDPNADSKEDDLWKKCIFLSLDDLEIDSFNNWEYFIEDASTYGLVPFIQEDSSLVKQLFLRSDSHQIKSTDVFKLTYYPGHTDDETFNQGNCPGAEIQRIVSGKYLFFSLLQELVNKYETDYSSLKEELKVLPGTEFGFEVLNQNGEVILRALNEIVAEQTYVGEELIQYIDSSESTDIKTGTLRIIVW